VTIQGLSDTWFEVMYGAQQELHSKSSEILDMLLNTKAQFDEEKQFMIRILFIKLFNSIDTSKQQLLFESIYKNLIIFEEAINEDKLIMGLQVIEDAIKLKFGNRLSHLSVIQLMESLNYLLTTKLKVL